MTSAARLRLERLLRISVCAVLIPIAVVWIGGWLTAASALPPSVGVERDSEAIDAAAAALGSISTTLFTIEIALIGASGVLLQFPKDRPSDAVDWALALLAFLSSVLAIFVGYRFLMGLAEQLALDVLRLRLITERLEIQALFTLASASLLLALAVDRMWRTAPNRAPAIEEAR